MTARERVLAVGVLLAVALGGGAFVFYTFLYAPLRDRDAALQAVRGDLERKRERINEVLSSRPKLDRWRALSLPADTDLARREYEKYLSELLRKSGFAAGSFSVVPKPTDNKTSPTIPGKGPIYTRLTFTVLAHGSLSNLVEALEGFYRTGLLHQVRNLTVQRPLTAGDQQQQQDGLDINLTVEALCVTGGGNRPYLLPNLEPRLVALDAVAALRGAPAGVALAAWAATPMGPEGPGILAQPGRNYESVAAKDIFHGEPQAEAKGEDIVVTRFVHLTDITRDGRRAEAFLYDRASNRKTRLRAEPGFDAFRVTNDAGETVVRGKVLRINERDVVFQADGKQYALHVGQSLEDAMRRPLSEEELRAMGVGAEDTKVSRREGGRR
jgi:hypothetical protein